LETAWNASIVNFGHEPSQGGVRIDRATRWVLNRFQRIEDAIGRIGIVPVMTWSLIGLGVASLAFAAVGVSIKFVVGHVRRRETPGAAVHGEAATLYARTLRAWKRLGVPKPTWCGAMEHASTLSGEPRTLGEAVLRVCYQSFFGHRRVPPDEIERAAVAVRALERVARTRRKSRQSGASSSSGAGTI
jgi:hypothetical protein